MMPTYPINTPSTPGVIRISWSEASVVTVQKSVFTLNRKTYVWPGQQRMFTAEFPPMTLPQAKEWSAFLMKLNGAEGTFYWSDTVGSEMGGTAAGNILVDGASQTGNSVDLKGLLPNHVKAFKAGDWISINDRLYTVLEDSPSDASGNCTVEVWPSVATAPADEDPVSIGSDARGVFALVESSARVWPVSRLMEGLKISAEEAI